MRFTDREIKILKEIAKDRIHFEKLFLNKNNEKGEEEWTLQKQ